jgi:hypothetical protein
LKEGRLFAAAARRIMRIGDRTTAASAAWSVRRKQASSPRPTQGEKRCGAKRDEPVVAALLEPDGLRQTGTVHRK